MLKFIQHIPSFVDSRGMDVFELECSSVEELLSNPFFDKYKGDKFSHFTKSKERNRYALMSISDNGFSWWVVGFILTKEPLDLPEWEGWKFRARLDGENVIVGTGADCVAKVVMISGGTLTLDDGRVAHEGWIN